MRLALALVLASCHPPAPVAQTGNVSAVPAHARAEGPLAFDEHCDADLGDPITLGIGRETIAVIICPVAGPGSADDPSSTMTAYLVRRSRPNWGTSEELDTWTQSREAGGSTELAGVIRDARGVVTRAILIHNEGGLDNPGRPVLTVYDVAQAAFTPQRLAGAEITLVVAPDGRSAIARVCTLSPGGTFYQDKACAAQVGATTRPIAID